MITALYVQKDGCYYGDDRIDPWDEARDARTYRGTNRVIAHPPCERWGRYWSGGPSARVRRNKGDDGGCFASALWAARTFGGVIEHPEASHAWGWYGLTKPPKSGGWIEADEYGGITCCVEQGHYGHPARKATWLYGVGCIPFELKWGQSEGQRLDEGFHSKEERRAARAAGVKPRKRLSTRENLSTPEPFKELLIRLVDFY
jgi:hypothetical protein